MPLTGEQKEKIEKVVKPLLENGCHLCGCKDWTLFDDYVMCPIIDVESMMPIEGKLALFVIITCHGCSQTVYFSAGGLGLV